MNLKFKTIIGVIVPLAIVILLVILGSLEIGFSIEKDFIKTIPLKDLMRGTNGEERIELGKIILENDYFLSKIYTLKSLKTCLIDEEKMSGAINAGNIFYSEGDYNARVNWANEILIPSEGYYGRYSNERNVEITAYGNKEIKVLFSPKYFSSRGGASRKDSEAQTVEELVEEYSDYDFLVLVEEIDSGTDYYLDRKSCQDLSEEDIAGAIKITLEK